MQTDWRAWPNSQQLKLCSEELDWSEIFVSVQCEQPFEASFAPLADHMICVHRDGPVNATHDVSGAPSKRPMLPGSLFLMPAGRDFHVGHDKPVTTTRIFVSDTLVRRTAEELAVGDPAKIEFFPCLGFRDPSIEQISTILVSFAASGLRAQECIDSISQVLALQLLTKHSAAKWMKVPADGLTHRQLRVVDDKIASRLGETIKMAELAAAVGLSPTHFARQFKKSKGISPHQHVMATRIATARQLLRSDLAIAEIAFRCGFSHQEHLTTVFRQMVGVTPAVYRMECRS
jgi:AraC family transcriptional regulator